MNREIKFRAWFEKNKEMLYSDNLHIDTKGGIIGAMFQPAIKGYFMKPLLVSEDEPIRIMQFTGLKDKNGKEIYEGDIMKMPHPLQFVEHPGKVGEKRIISSSDKAVVKYIEKVGAYFAEFKECGSMIGNGVTEIIGNIYENPELLK